MSALTVRLPNSLHVKIKELAQAEGLSINQFMVTAAAKKMAALLSEDYLSEEAKRGQRADFEKVLKAVPHVEPEERDQRNWDERNSSSPKSADGRRSAIGKASDR